MNAADAAIRISVVILTYRRDTVLAKTLATLKATMGARDDVEVILVDNNADAIDRLPLLADFAHVQWVRTGFNKGVTARNDGMDVGRGDIFILLDDDVEVATAGFIERFETVFSSLPEVGVVTVRKLDGETLTVLPQAIPHTRKSMDMDRAFFTFRFVGGLVALRGAVHAQLGGFYRELFYGEEEREYSYRILKAGWKIYYEPGIAAIETNDAGGRRGRASRRTDTLLNRYILSYLHRPALVMLVDFLAFTAYLWVIERGRVNVFAALGRFLDWLARSDRPRRQPIGPREVAYIRACGGTIWR